MNSLFINFKKTFPSSETSVTGKKSRISKWHPTKIADKGGNWGTAGLDGGTGEGKIRTIRYSKSCRSSEKGGPNAFINVNIKSRFCCPLSLQKSPQSGESSVQHLPTGGGDFRWKGLKITNQTKINLSVSHLNLSYAYGNHTVTVCFKKKISSLSQWYSGLINHL